MSVDSANCSQPLFTVLPEAVKRVILDSENWLRVGRGNKSWVTQFDQMDPNPETGYDVLITWKLLKKLQELWRRFAACSEHV